MAKEELKVVQLLQPARSSVLGTVVKSSFKQGGIPGSKFKHDTHITTIALIEGGVMFDVFVTATQWEAYGLKDIFYNQNVVNVTVEEHIEGVTGYPNETGEMIPAGFSGKYFVNAVECDVLSLTVALAQAGAGAVASIILDSLSKTRHQHMVSTVKSQSVILPEE